MQADTKILPLSERKEIHLLFLDHEGALYQLAKRNNMARSNFNNWFAGDTDSLRVQNILLEGAEVLRAINRKSGSAELAEQPRAA